MNRIIWHTVPAIVGRAFKTLGIALTDGSYLAAWPGAGLAAPAIAILCGASLAVAQGEITFTYSLLGLAIFAFLAGAGAGVGCYALAAYVVVDFFTGAWRDSFHRPDALTVLQSSGAVLISYLLLATLLVLVPLTALGLREETMRLLRMDRPVIRQAVHVAFMGVLIWAWAQATAFLIRPVWSFHDRAPDVDAISTLQHGTWVFTLAGMAATAGRGLAEERALRKLPSWLENPAVDPGRQGWRLPVWAAVALRSLLLVVLMSGLLASIVDALILFVVLLVPLTIQALSARLTPVAWLAERIPVLARVAAAALAAYLIATVVVEPQVRATSSFFPMLLSVTLSLMVAAILLPNREA